MSSLSDQKDSFTMSNPGDIVMYGSGYIRVHVQKDKQKNQTQIVRVKSLQIFAKIKQNNTKLTIT